MSDDLIIPVQKIQTFFFAGVHGGGDHVCNSEITTELPRYLKLSNIVFSWAGLKYLIILR